MKIYKLAYLVLALILTSAYKAKPVDAVSLAECITNSQYPGNIIGSAPCGIFDIVSTRQESAAGATLDVTVKFMVHSPYGAPKAVVILFAGGAGNSGIEGDAATGKVTSAGNNFLVRSAQLFAEEGFLTVTIDRPSTTVGFSNAMFDQYRVSPAHAQDIATVVNKVNALYGTRHLNLFLAGTSRGAISITAQNMLGIGSLFSNPVTSVSDNPENLWVGATSTHTRLRPDFITVPTHVLAHRHDGCYVSTPKNSVTLHHDLLAAGLSSVLNGLTGGFELDPNPCDALRFHGFLGIEREAVRSITERMTQIVRKQQNAFPGNIKPRAFNFKVATAANTAITIDLGDLTFDRDGDPLHYSLPHDASSRGGTLGIRGRLVRYTPPARWSNFMDGFVFRVDDGKGGTSNGIIRVKVD